MSNEIGITAATQIEEQPALPGLRVASDSLLDRARFARQYGLSTFNGKRNYYDIFGYNVDLTVDDYWRRYERGGLAGAVVDALPKATWRGGFELIENDCEGQFTPFEIAWNALAERFDIASLLEQADILSQISTYGVIVIGDGQQLSLELSKATRGIDSLLFLRPMLGAGGPSIGRQNGLTSNLMGVSSAVDVTIDELETDVTNFRYGQPKYYRLVNPSDSKDTTRDRIHFSRCVHIADRCVRNDIYGMPALQRVWNLLDDLDKVTGGGAEAFFQRANQGRVWSIDPSITNVSADEQKSFAENIEKFQNEMTRDVKVRGVKVETLGSDTADFESPTNAVITQIAGTARIPKRILTGSEMGELASSQDRDNWRDQVNGRRGQHAYPKIVKRLVDRLILYQYLPQPASKLTVRWGSVLNFTEQEKIDKLIAWSAAKTAEGQVFTNDEIRAECYERDPLTPEEKSQLREFVNPIPAVVAPSVDTSTPHVLPFVKRAAESLDEDLVERLAEAIDAGDTETVLALSGVADHDA